MKLAFFLGVITLTFLFAPLLLWLRRRVALLHSLVERLWQDALARGFVDDAREIEPTLRLFLAASAVWFLRIGLMAWAMLTGGLGMDFKTYRSVHRGLGVRALLVSVADAGALLPRERPRAPGHQVLLASVLVALTSVMALGIFGATTRMWLPRL